VPVADGAKSLSSHVQDESKDAGKLDKKEKKKRDGKKPAKTEKKAGTEPKMYWRKKKGAPENTF
jgi:hypothetical protein